MPKRQPRPLDRASLPLHGGLDAGDREIDAPVVRALYQSVNYIQEFGTGGGMRYPRYGNAPNAEAVQRRIAALEGAEASVLLSSGMGATACALMALLRPGDHIVSSNWVYGGTRALLEQELTSLGVEVTLIDPLEVRAWRRAINSHTRVVFLETPVNPTCRVLDLGPVSYICKERGIAMVVDATFASPVNFRPLEHGADVSIHSATKYLNGHHDILGGVVSGTAPYIEEVRQKMMVWGQAPDPFAAWLLERGLKTLDVRMQRHNENAMRVAQWADGCREIRKVHYPGLPSHPDHELALRMLDGFGGMMAIELAGGARAVDRMLRKLRVFRHAPSLGGVESLVSEPRYSSHMDVAPDDRARAGIPDGFLRLSIGIESADDLITDLEQALR